ncbi:MAG: hypothetical protein D6715_00215 [Calditrichaeota bacterium]|nr:MAG: hypothetical protein D6715_00215 [Calditrichota bacterium]
MKVLVAHSSLPMRSSLLKMLSGMEAISMIIITDNFTEMLNNVNRYRPELLIFEYCLSNGDCEKALRQIASAAKQSKKVVLVSRQLAPEALERLKAMADVWLDPAGNPEGIQKAVEGILRDQSSSSGTGKCN